MTARFGLTPRAVQDLRAIGRYTLKRWGKEQRDTYLRALDDRFGWLADKPARGRLRADIAAGYYCFPQGEHLVFYIIGAAGIEIIGVLHQSMDIRLHMTEGDSDA